MVFRFDGFDISAILFSNVFPSAPNSQAILLKGKKPDAEMEKIIFAIIQKDEENGFTIWDEAVLPLPSACSDAARKAEVKIGGKLTSATLKFLMDTAEISITLEDIDIEHYQECYIFTPAPNMLEL